MRRMREDDSQSAVAILLYTLARGVQPVLGLLNKLGENWQKRFLPSVSVIISSIGLLQLPGASFVYFSLQDKSQEFRERNAHHGNPASPGPACGPSAWTRGGSWSTNTYGATG